MKKLLDTVRSLKKDESGASFVEYTVLLGVILAVSIVILSNVGSYANTIWGNVSGEMAAAAGAGGG
jgi:Flp pilus assembly pilin Flp